MNAPAAPEPRTPDPEPAVGSPPLLTWRPMLLWTAAILAALGLAWFIGAVAVPVMRVRSVLNDERNYRKGEIHYDIAKLGGPERAARVLSSYLHLPAKLAPRKLSCVKLLRQSGVHGIPALKRALASPDMHVRLEAAAGLVREPDDQTRNEIARMLMAAAKNSDPHVRFYAACVMGDFKPPHKLLLPVLVTMLDDKGTFIAPSGYSGQPPRTITMAALWSLGEYGRDAQQAVPKIEWLLQDPNSDVRTAAAEALKKIRGDEPPK